MERYDSEVSEGAVWIEAPPETVPGTVRHTDIDMETEVEPGTQNPPQANLDLSAVPALPWYRRNIIFENPQPDTTKTGDYLQRAYFRKFVLFLFSKPGLS
jgi:hypothetical protein